MGGDSWDAALLESEVRGLVRKQRKQKQKTRQRSKTAERLAAKNLKRRAPTEQRADYPCKAAGPGVQPAAGSTCDGVNRKNFAQHLDLERWPCGPNGKRLKVGSDCSGLDAATVALDKLGVSDRVTQEFCCDKLPECQTFLKAVHKPKLLFTDVVNRDLEKVPKVDVYTAGFPCQPWSSEGKGQGRRDELGRGRVFDHVAKYIEKRPPKVFLLENVQAISFKSHKKAFEAMLRTLRQSGCYFVTWRVLNASDFGLPQSRPRLYIVGLLRTELRSDFAGFPWPKPKVVDPLPLRRFLCGGGRRLEARLAARLVRGLADQGRRGQHPRGRRQTAREDVHSGCPLWPRVSKHDARQDPVPYADQGKLRRLLPDAQGLSTVPLRGGDVELAGFACDLPAPGAWPADHRPAARDDGGERDPHERPHAPLGPHAHDGGVAG